jgi:hypothetical protein
MTAGALQPAAGTFTRAGSRVFFRENSGLEDAGVQGLPERSLPGSIKLGILSEAPTPLVPGHELWIKRREPWLRPIASTT